MGLIRSSLISPYNHSSLEPNYFEMFIELLISWMAFYSLSRPTSIALSVCQSLTSNWDLISMIVNKVCLFVSHHLQMWMHLFLFWTQNYAPAHQTHSIIFVIKKVLALLVQARQLFTWFQEVAEEEASCAGRWTAHICFKSVLGPSLLGFRFKNQVCVFYSFFQGAHTLGEAIFLG